MDRAPALASPAVAREFLATGAAPHDWAFLDDQGRTVDQLPETGMLRLIKRVGDRLIGLRIAAEDVPDLVDLLPAEVFG